MSAAISGVAPHLASLMRATSRNADIPPHGTRAAQPCSHRPSLPSPPLLSCAHNKEETHAGTRGRRWANRQGRADLRRRRGRRRHRQWPRGGDFAGAVRHESDGRRSRSQARRTHRRDDQGRRRRGRGHRRRRHRREGLPEARGRDRQSIRPARFPRQQCRHRQPRQRGRGEAGAISEGHADQCREHVPALEICDPCDGEDRERRRDRQHLLDLGAASARAHHLHHLEGGGHWPHARHGSRSRPRQHPRQLHLPGTDVHAHGLCPRHEREGARQPRTEPRC